MREHFCKIKNKIKNKSEEKDINFESGKTMHGLVPEILQ